MSTTYFHNNCRPVVIYQCNKTEICQNLRCFWKQRDCFGLEPFPCYYDKDGNMPGEIKNAEIAAKYGESYFPEHTVSVGTNSMYITCKDVKYE